MRSRLLMVLSLAPLVLAAMCAPAFATLGVGTTTPRIVIDQDVYPGGVYRLPPIPAINTGTELEVIKVFVDRASKQTELYADPRWFAISPTAATVGPGTAAPFDSVLTLPLVVAPGTYQALVVAQPFDPTANGSRPNIEVGTKVVFRVVPSNWFMAVLWRIYGLFMLWSPWSLIVLAVLVATLLAWIVNSRFHFSFKIARR
jgi:hypothetical protein